MSCGVGHRHGSDVALLWLWCRLAATAPIRHLAWEPPICHECSPKKKKKKRKKKERKKRNISDTNPAFPYLLMGKKNLYTWKAGSWDRKLSFASVFTLAPFSSLSLLPGRAFIFCGLKP